METLSHRVDLNIQSPPPYRSGFLSQELGINVYIKQEDYASGPGITSKLRKLEYLLYRKNISASSVLVSAGSLPSSQNVAIAYAAKRLGIRAHLIYGGESTRKPERKTGNYYLASRFNPEETWFEGTNWEQHSSWLRDVAGAETAAGYAPIVFMPGLSDWPGLLGYTRLGLELDGYFREKGQIIDYTICPTGSGGVLAGLALAAYYAQTPSRVIGVTFAQGIPSAQKAFAALANQVKDHTNYNIGDRSVCDITDGTLGVKYGELNPEMVAYSDQLLLNEGLLLDPVYTLKTYISLNKLVKEGAIPQGSNVLLLITGTCYNEISGLLKQ